ncbi:MAG TPA: glycine betaine/L-proline ABC transporter ATP-binding protein [Propionibacteriaceae bacterium]|nr:glycine betaine/L-proline ABC transporter ATP-binding protein [Propionibacteriaceae bacterium]
MTAISASGLYKVFGRRPGRGVDALRTGGSREALLKDGLTAAVIDATFDVQPGEIFVVMGLSGSGKSTLIRMVNGLIPPTAGRLAIQGREIEHLSPNALRDVRRRNVSMVFQHFALLPHRTVGENAAYGLAVQGVNRADRERAAQEALELVGLKGWGDHLPGELSGGMQQRVGLARALAAKTDILLMDEAFSALDPLIRRGMQDQLIDLQQQLDKTILFITHDLNEAMRLGDRIAMMRDGRIEQIGTAEQILNEPANNYVAQFVHDVDRSRVLTAAAIMEPPPATLGAGAGPQAAHKLMRESHLQWLLVVNRDRTPRGVLWDDDVAGAVRAQRPDLPWSAVHEMPTVHESVPLADLFALSAQHLSPIVVTDDRGRVSGVIPRVTLLAAAGGREQLPDRVDAAERPTAPAGQEPEQTPTLERPTPARPALAGANATTPMPQESDPR